MIYLFLRCVFFCASLVVSLGAIVHDAHGWYLIFVSIVGAIVIATGISRDFAKGTLIVGNALRAGLQRGRASLYHDPANDEPDIRCGGPCGQDIGELKNTNR